MKTTARIATLGATAGLSAAAAAAVFAGPAVASPVHQPVQQPTRQSAQRLTPQPAGAVFVQTDNLAGNTVVAYAQAADGSLTKVGVYPTGGLVSADTTPTANAPPPHRRPAPPRPTPTTKPDNSPQQPRQPDQAPTPTTATAYAPAKPPPAQPPSSPGATSPARTSCSPKAPRTTSTAPTACPWNSSGPPWSATTYTTNSDPPSPSPTTPAPSPAPTPTTPTRRHRTHRHLLNPRLRRRLHRPRNQPGLPTSPLLRPSHSPIPHHRPRPRHHRPALPLHQRRPPQRHRPNRHHTRQPRCRRGLLQRRRHRRIRVRCRRGTHRRNRTPKRDGPYRHALSFSKRVNWRRPGRILCPGARISPLRRSSGLNSWGQGVYLPLSSGDWPTTQPSRACCRRGDRSRYSRQGSVRSHSVL
jgi:hypothetical protein